MVKKYYSISTQANFPQCIESSNSNNDDDIVILSGIAYDDFIICGECSSTILIEEIEEEFVDEAIINFDWRDISSFILGD